MLNRSRIWLFAPFIALFALGVGFFFLWSYAGDEIEARLSAENITWKSAVRAGFPARLTMDFMEMDWAQGKLNWSVPALRFTVMPFETDHAVVDFSSPHTLTTQFSKMRLDHSGNLASLVLDTQGLARASFAFTKPQLRVTANNEDIALAGDDVALHVRRAPDNAARADIALRTGRITGDARLGITRSEVDIDTPQSWLTGALAAIGREDAPVPPLNLVGDFGGAMNAALSIGSNSPELSKSLEMISAICRPESLISPSRLVNSAMAIGVGATCPSVMRMRCCAVAGSAEKTNITAANAIRLDRIDSLTLNAFIKTPS